MRKLLVETSARHVHLAEEDFYALFGKGEKLTPKKDLSQPGQYASEERVSLVGPRGRIDRISILGPFRKQSQVEISATDARTVGIMAPVRESGHLEGTPGCKLVGPKGEVELNAGVIIAQRHIHASPADAEGLGVSNHEIVSVLVETPERTTTFGNVVVRVHPNFDLAMHIDTDESNAAGIFGATVYGKVIKH